jgi:hypothetical protein
MEVALSNRARLGPAQDLARDLEARPAVEMIDRMQKFARFGGVILARCLGIVSTDIAAAAALVHAALARNRGSGDVVSEVTQQELAPTVHSIKVALEVPIHRN